MAQYIKDIIGMTPEGVISARINAIGSVELNKNGKEFRKVTFGFPSTGKEHTEGVFEFNFKGSLSGVQVGDTVEIRLDNGWPAYKILPRDGSGQSQNNFQQVKTERLATKEFTDAEEKRELKDIEISLQGLVQAYIIQGSSDPLTEAADMRKLIKAKAREIQIGFTLPKENTLTREEALNAFTPETYPG